jgi:hypothetical protein
VRLPLRPSSRAQHNGATIIIADVTCTCRPNFGLNTSTKPLPREELSRQTLSLPRRRSISATREWGPDRPGTEIQWRKETCHQISNHRQNQLYHPNRIRNCRRNMIRCRRRRRGIRNGEWKSEGGGGNSELGLSFEGL